MSRISRFALLALLAITLAVPAHAAKKVCLYDAAGLVADLQALLGSGYTVQNYTAAQWSVLATADFQGCAGIFVPDTDNIQSGYTALNANKTTWGAAVTGNVVLSGVHMSGHGFQVPALNPGGQGRVVQGLMSFITSAAGTGFLSGTDRAVDSYRFASVFGVGGNNVQLADDDIAIPIGSSPKCPISLALLKDLSGAPLALPSFLANLPLPTSSGGFGVLPADVANIGNSLHNTLPIRPAGVWSTVAVDCQQPILNTSPQQYVDAIIARQAGGAAPLGGGITVFVNPAGGQVITPSATTSFTFSIGRISGGRGFGFAPNLPGVRGLAFLFCGGGRGRFIVVVNGRSGTGTISCI